MTQVRTYRVNGGVAHIGQSAKGWFWSYHKIGRGPPKMISVQGKSFLAWPGNTNAMGGSTTFAAARRAIKGFYRR